MSTRRLSSIVTIPPFIKKVFKTAPTPATPEERLWRERVARMTLDALGYTNLTMKRLRHNEAVRYARRWYRGLFVDLEDPKLVDDPVATFDAAGLSDFTKVRDLALSIEPYLFPDKNEVDDE